MYYEKNGSDFVLISIVAAFVLLNINVDKMNVGGIVGTVVVPSGASQEDIDRTRSVLRIAGFGWVFIGILSLIWVVRNSKR